MRMMFKVFAKKLFGSRYERIGKTLLTYLILFWGLRIAGFQIQIRPFILYLMVGTFTAGGMWQALSSRDMAENMKNMFMLPFGRRHMIFAYVSALGSYTLLVRTGALLAVMFAVSPCDGLKIAGCILCACNAAIMSAGVYSWGKYRGAGAVWAGDFIILLFWTCESRAFLPIVVGNMLAGTAALCVADAYSFFNIKEQSRRHQKARHRYSVWRYLLRYLMDHKNYLVNTVAMWGVACILPVLFGNMDHVFVLPVGFAILSLNTPICILLSCDPALEQAVRSLPGQKKTFCIPYCLFIFLVNMAADAIYLLSWRLLVGEVTPLHVFTAVLFALQSAVASVALEWFYPVRGWKIESDLWHCPRKYVVPAVMMLISGISGSVSWAVYALGVFLAAECAALYVKCCK